MYTIVPWAIVSIVQYPVSFWKLHRTQVTLMNGIAGIVKCHRTVHNFIVGSDHYSSVYTVQ